MSSDTQLAVPQSDKKEKASLIEFSSEVLPEPNEGVTFGDSPAHCICPHCEQSVITFIDLEASWVTWALGFVVWFSLGWMAFWVLPLLWPVFKDVVHHCPRCLNVVERKSRISLPTFRSEVMTFKIGGCAIVLARKYVMIFVGLIAVISSVYLLRSNTVLQARHSIPRGPDSPLSWDDFLYDCGPRTSLRHRASSATTFEEKFRRKTFTWQGEVQQIREGSDLKFFRTKSVAMVRMHPPRYPRRDIPDIALLFSEDRNKEVAELNPGDWVEFEATMTAHGTRGDPEVMMLWRINKHSKSEQLPTAQKQHVQLTKTEEILFEALMGASAREERLHGEHSEHDPTPAADSPAEAIVDQTSERGEDGREKEDATQETPDDGQAELVAQDPTDAV